MRITCVIPDRGDRPEFIEQACRLIDRQTLNPDDVIISTSQMGVTGNVRAGYEKAQSGIVIILENDDNYSADYIQFVVDHWDNRYNLLGFNETMYYHLIRKKYTVIQHPGRSSLFQTTIKAGLNISWPADSENFLDLHLWNNLNGKLIDGWHAVGMKHGIGSVGGRAHGMNFKYNYSDPQGEYLKFLTNNDPFYLNFK